MKQQSRRQFLTGLVAGAGTLVLPYEPKRIYSFARVLRVPGLPTWEDTTAMWAVGPSLLTGGIAIQAYLALCCKQPGGIFATPP